MTRGFQSPFFCSLDSSDFSWSSRIFAADFLLAASSATLASYSSFCCCTTFVRSASARSGAAAATPAGVWPANGASDRLRFWNATFGRARFAGEPGDDAEGWTNEETEEYSGWLSDRQRRWRDGALLQSEGFETFGARFGAKAFTLHHKFYLHVDAGNNFWLSAEDGCEGVATPPAPPPRDFGASARSPFAIFGK